MELFETMLKRRSIRKYKDDDILKEYVDKILQAGLLAPSSRNIKPCEFIVIENKDVLEKLSYCKSAGASMLKGANKAIVVIGDSKKSDVWIEDCSIAMTYMHLMATDLGIGSCWIQCRLRDNKETSAEVYIRDLLNIPDYYSVLAILSLGISNEEKNDMKIEDLDIKKIHFDSY